MLKLWEDIPRMRKRSLIPFLLIYLLTIHYVYGIKLGQVIKTSELIVMEKQFKNRIEAAFQLSVLLMEYKDKDGVILAIPGGGVPIGFVLANELNMPMDLALSKKISHPHESEFAIGSVSLNEAIIDASIDVSEEYINQETQRIREELKETYKMLGGGEEPAEVKNKIIIITDDGIPIGDTMLYTIRMVQKQEPAEIIIAVPVIAPGAAEMLRDEIDKLVTISKPPYFNAVAQFYEEFETVGEEEIVQLLRSTGKNIQK